MKASARIIFKELHGHWSAWFADQQDAGVGGADPTDSVRRLIAGSGEDLAECEILADDQRTSDGHLEFLMQRVATRFRYRHHREIEIRNIADTANEYHSNNIQSRKESQGFNSATRRWFVWA